MKGITVTALFILSFLQFAGAQDAMQLVEKVKVKKNGRDLNTHRHKTTVADLNEKQPLADRCHCNFPKQTKSQAMKL